MMKRTDPLLAEYEDNLPHYGLLPAAVARGESSASSRWGAKGRAGRERATRAARKWRTGPARDLPGKPEPFLALAFLHAGSRKDKEALADLRAAVIARIHRPAAFLAFGGPRARVRKSMDLLALEDWIPKLQKTRTRGRDGTSSAPIPRPRIWRKL
jgi:hypothetical protein